MEGNDKCDLCELEIDDDEKPCTEELDLSLLIASSKKRDDGKWKKWQDVNAIAIHDSCRINYLNTSDNIENESSDMPTSMNEVEEKEETKCDLLDKSCIFCGKICDKALEKGKTAKKRRRFGTVGENSVLREEIENALKVVVDDRLNAVRDRIMHRESLTGLKYHYLCKMAFSSWSGNRERGRPITPKYQEGIEKIYNLLDNSRDCQYSIEDLLEKTGCGMTDSHLKVLLKKKYGNDIIISSFSGKKSIVTFKNHGEQILAQYYERGQSFAEENDWNVIEEAGKSINNDIHAMSIDKSLYPSKCQSLDEVDDTIPESLKTFLDIVIVEQRKKNRDKYVSRMQNIAHAIIANTIN